MYGDIYCTGTYYERGEDSRRLAYVRGVNFGFWCQLGCSRENAIICSPYVAVKVSFRATGLYTFNIQS